MYLSYRLAHTRIIDLLTFWNESIWVELKAVFFDALNKNIEKVLDITNNIIIPLCIFERCFAS